MEISARVTSTSATHTARVRTDASEKSLAVPAKAGGHGSAINGGEFLMLALATCYCNDLYREAAQLGMVLDAVDVQARADFPGIGLAAQNVSYEATVRSSASAAEIERLLARTDAVAEVHNTLRAGVPVAWVRS